jgi:hypothetical protein
MHTAAVSLAVALFLAACGWSTGADNGGSSAGATPDSRPRSTASIFIASPRDGSTVKGNRTILRIELDGGALVQATSTDLQPDEGHLHVSLDGSLITMTSALSQELTELDPGIHLVEVEYVANDHAPFDPRVIAKSSFEVTG